MQVSGLYPSFRSENMKLLLLCNLPKETLPFVVLIILCHPVTKCVIFHHRATMEHVTRLTTTTTTTTSNKRRGRALSLCPLQLGIQKLLVKDQIWLARDIFQRIKMQQYIMKNNKIKPLEWWIRSSKEVAKLHPVEPVTLTGCPPDFGLPRPACSSCWSHPCPSFLSYSSSSCSSIFWWCRSSRWGRATRPPRRWRSEPKEVLLVTKTRDWLGCLSQRKLYLFVK